MEYRHTEVKIAQTDRQKDPTEIIIYPHTWMVMNGKNEPCPVVYGSPFLEINILILI